MIGVFWTTGEYVRELRLALVCHMVTSTTRTVQLLGHRNLRATQAEAAASSDWNKKRTHLKGTGTLPIPIDPLLLDFIHNAIRNQCHATNSKSDFCSTASTTNQPAQTFFL